jgi:hypothetical protein
MRSLYPRNTFDFVATVGGVEVIPLTVSTTGAGNVISNPAGARVVNGFA